jgi:hypothetical protein
VVVLDESLPNLLRDRDVSTGTTVHLGDRMNRVKMRMLLACLTAAAALAVGMVQTADAKPATPSQVNCAQAGGCTELADHGL